MGKRRRGSRRRRRRKTSAAAGDGETFAPFSFSSSSLPAPDPPQHVARHDGIVHVRGDGAAGGFRDEVGEGPAAGVDEESWEPSFFAVSVFVAVFVFASAASSAVLVSAFNASAATAPPQPFERQHRPRQALRHQRQPRVPRGSQPPHVRQRNHFDVPQQLDAEDFFCRRPERRRREPPVAEDEDLCFR